jgi:predicted RNA-binding Zn-ribbon protein involved in translation (DUF1610 family)
MRRIWLKYVFVGVVLGFLCGLLEAVLAASGEGFRGDRIMIYYGQFGFAMPLLGGVIAHIVFKRRERAREMRRRHNLCVACGYNLTGNVSGACPECGEKISSKQQAGFEHFFKPLRTEGADHRVAQGLRWRISINLGHIC